MADIAMCTNKECPSHEQCYRFTAKPNDHWQAYNAFGPLNDEDKCSHFMANWAEDEGR